MSPFATLLTAGLESIERDLTDPSANGGLPPLLGWRSLSYPCVPNPLGEATDLVPGGFEEDIDLVIFVRADSFLAPITADSDQVTVDSDAITVDRTGSTYEFGEEITVDSAVVTADSDQITVDSDQRLPEPDELVTYGGKTYRVVRITEIFSCYRLELQSPHR